MANTVERLHESTIDLLVGHRIGGLTSSVIEICAEHETIIERFRDEADLCEDKEPEDADGQFVIPAGERKRWWCIWKFLCERLQTFWGLY